MKKCNSIPCKMGVLILPLVLLFIGNFAVHAQEFVPAEIIPANVDSLYEFLGFSLIIGVLIWVNELLRKEQHH